MKSFIVLALFVAAAVAAPPAGPDADAEIVSYENNNIGVEGYKFGYKTSNGIGGEEQGQLTNVGTEDEAIEVRGQYSYTGPDGVQYLVQYSAGKDGFQPSGAHLPVPPQ